MNAKKLVLGTVEMEPISKQHLEKFSKIVRESIKQVERDSKKAQKNVDIARKYVAR